MLVDEFVAEKKATSDPRSFFVDLTHSMMGRLRRSIGILGVKVIDAGSLQDLTLPRRLLEKGFHEEIATDRKLTGAHIVCHIAFPKSGFQSDQQRM